MDCKLMASTQATLIAKLRSEITTLKAKIAALEKNSATSSKPPAWVKSGRLERVGQFHYFGGEARRESRYQNGQRR